MNTIIFGCLLGGFIGGLVCTGLLALTSYQFRAPNTDCAFNEYLATELASCKASGPHSCPTDTQASARNTQCAFNETLATELTSCKASEPHPRPTDTQASTSNTNSACDQCLAAELDLCEKSKKRLSSEKTWGKGHCVIVVKEDPPSGPPAVYQGITLKKRSVYMEAFVDGGDLWMQLHPSSNDG